MSSRLNLTIHIQAKMERKSLELKKQIRGSTNVLVFVHK